MRAQRRDGGSGERLTGQVASRVRGLFLDLDGTLYVRREPVAGAVSAVSRLRKEGFRLRFLSNTDSKRAATVWTLVRAMGFEIEAAEVFTAASAAQAFVRSLGGRTCLPLVSAELEPEFAEFRSDGEDADFVVVGDCRESLDYATLNQAFRALRGGARLIGLQRGRFFLDAHGANLDTGAVLAALEYAAETQALILGKPSPEFFHQVLADVDLQPDEVLVVGDDLSTDVAGAHGAGMRAVLVRTGKFTREALGRFERTDGRTPDWILDSAADLPALVSGL